MNEIRIYRCEFLQCFSKNVVYVCPQNMSSNINNENETCAFKRIYIYTKLEAYALHAAQPIV